MMKRNRSGKSHRRKKYPPKAKSVYLIKVRRFIKANFVALVSILVSVLTAFVIYYLSYSEPDIRPFFNPSNVKGYNAKANIDSQARCTYYEKGTFRFKNFSIKSGYIDKVEFVPVSFEVLPEINMLHIDKSLIHWREEKNIEFTFSFTFDFDACAKLLKKEHNMTVEMKFYDNTGKLLDKSIEGNPFRYLFDIGDSSDYPGNQFNNKP